MLLDINVAERAEWFVDLDLDPHTQAIIVEQVTAVEDSPALVLLGEVLLTNGTLGATEALAGLVRTGSFGGRAAILGFLFENVNFGLSHHGLHLFLLLIFGH